jgi:hypothetical protein
MSICLRINTLLLLAGAENDNWETAEVYYAPPSATNS